MAKTVGCTDFDQTCDFRVTAGDDETELIEDTATAHAMKYHPEFAPDETAMREAIKSQIKDLLEQSHTNFDPAALIQHV